MTLKMCSFSWGGRFCSIEGNILNFGNIDTCAGCMYMCNCKNCTYAYAELGANVRKQI